MYDKLEKMTDAQFAKFERDNLAWLRPRSKEWNAAWRGMAEQTGDEDRVGECPVTFEVWQYMGSVRWEGGWRHEFRHRNHPSTGQRWMVRVRATKGWKPDDEKIRRRVLH